MPKESSGETKLSTRLQSFDRSSYILKLNPIDLRKEIASYGTLVKDSSRQVADLYTQISDPKLKSNKAKGEELRKQFDINKDKLVHLQVELMQRLQVLEYRAKNEEQYAKVALMITNISDLQELTTPKYNVLNNEEISALKAHLSALLESASKKAPPVSAITSSTLKVTSAAPVPVPPATPLAAASKPAAPDPAVDISDDILNLSTPAEWKAAIDQYSVRFDALLNERAALTEKKKTLTDQHQVLQSIHDTLLHRLSTDPQVPGLLSKNKDELKEVFEKLLVVGRALSLNETNLVRSQEPLIQLDFGLKHKIEKDPTNYPPLVYQTQTEAVQSRARGIHEDLVYSPRRDTLKENINKRLYEQEARQALLDKIQIQEVGKIPSSKALQRFRDFIKNVDLPNKQDELDRLDRDIYLMGVIEEKRKKLAIKHADLSGQIKKLEKRLTENDKVRTTEQDEIMRARSELARLRSDLVDIENYQHFNDWDTQERTKNAERLQQEVSLIFQSVQKAIEEKKEFAEILPLLKTGAHWDYAIMQVQQQLASTQQDYINTGKVSREFEHAQETLCQLAQGAKLSGYPVYDELLKPKGALQTLMKESKVYVSFQEVNDIYEKYQAAQQAEAAAQEIPTNKSQEPKAEDQSELKAKLKEITGSNSNSPSTSPSSTPPLSPQNGKVDKSGPSR